MWIEQRLRIAVGDVVGRLTGEMRMPVRRRQLGCDRLATSSISRARFSIGPP